MTEGLRYAVPVLSGDREALDAVPARELSLLVRRGEEPALVAELPRFVFAPVRAGSEAGRLLLLSDGAELASVPLVYAEGAEVTTCRNASKRS